MARAGAGDRSIVAAEIRLDADKRKKFEGRGKFVSIQIGVRGDGSGHQGAAQWTITELIVGTRRTTAGVSSEELEFLRQGRHASRKSKQEETCKPAKTSMSTPSTQKGRLVAKGMLAE